MCGISVTLRLWHRNAAQIGCWTPIRRGNPPNRVRGGGRGYQNGGPLFANLSPRLSLFSDHLRTVLAVKGSLRRAQQRRALDGSGPFRTTLLGRGKGSLRTAPLAGDHFAAILVPFFAATDKHELRRPIAPRNWERQPALRVPGAAVSAWRWPVLGSFEATNVAVETSWGEANSCSSPFQICKRNVRICHGRNGTGESTGCPAFPARSVSTNFAGPAEYCKRACAARPWYS